VSIGVNFNRETDQGLIVPGLTFRRTFTVCGQNFEVLADLGAPGDDYFVEKRVIDWRWPLLRAASYTSRPSRWRVTAAPGAASAPIAFMVAPKVGSARVAHAGTEVELKPGQFTMCFSGEPLVTQYSADSEVLLSFIPNTDMTQDARVTRHFGKERSVEGVGQLLLRHLDTSLQIAPALDSQGLAAASNAAGELLSSMVFASSTSSSSCADALRDQIKTYIEQKLREPGLSVDQIAAAHYVSVRTIYRLFDKSDQGVAAYIRSRRLERCRAEIEQRLDLSLAAICQRWGIPDPKHLARQYRRQFGESPSETRSRLRR
jgi:AraC-like DNA-binding protein